MDKDKKTHLIWQLDIDTVLEIYELAKKHGKKSGDNIQVEFEEILKKKKEKFKLLGTTNQDKSLMVGNLREEGFKILDLDEMKRQQELNNGS